MTVKQVEAGLCAAADAVAGESAARLAALPPGAALERQAMRIRKGMAAFCGKAGVLLGCASENPAASRRRHALTLLEAKGNEAATRYVRECPDGEATYLHALIFLEAFLGRYRGELAKAKAYGDDEAVFKLETQVSTLELIRGKWRAFGKEAGFNDVYGNG